LKLKLNTDWGSMESYTVISEPAKKTTTSRTADRDEDRPSERLPDWPTTPFDNDIKELYKQIDSLKEDLKKRDAKIEQLEDHVLTLETETVPLSSKKKRRLSNDELEKQLSDSKDDMILKLQKENERLKRQLGEETDKNDDTQDTPDTPMDTGKMMKMIEEKLNRGFQAIQTNLTNTIDERLNTPSTQNQQRSYATAVGINRTAKVSDLRSIMLANKNEEIEEEKDRKNRIKNIIIHGKVEESGETDDRQFAENLIKELQIGAPNISKIERIGMEKESGNGTALKRPIKLIMNSEEDKEKVLNNLRHLKGKTLYKSISITADYTYSERQLIKDYRERANIKNDFEEDKDYIWRVRGTPKNGLFLKRINKAN